MQTTFQFTAGVLAIDSPMGKMRIRWQPEPLADDLLPGYSRWKPFAPEFRIVSSNPPRPGATVIPDALDPKAAAFTAFHDEITPAIVEAVGRFHSHQWLLMQLLHHQPAMFDLTNANPVLAYCLANNDQFRGTRDSVSLQLALGHSRHKQRSQLVWLGFPGSESMARTLRRIPQESASPSLLRRLRNALETAPDMLGQLAHIPILNAGVLALVVNPALRARVAPTLLMTVAGRAEELSMALTADQLERALDLQRQMNVPPPSTPFSTLGQIERFQEHMDAAYQDWPRRRAETQRQAEQTRLAMRARRPVRPPEPPPARRPRPIPAVTRPIPPPPIPGTPHITPITTPQALREESEAQANCVVTYLPTIVAGDCYIYRVTAPERATLSIVPTSDGGWRRAELKGPKNRKVREITRQTVDLWLYQHRLSIS